MGKMTLAQHWAAVGATAETAPAQDMPADEVAVRAWFKASGGQPRFASEAEAPLYHQVVKFLDNNDAPISEELRNQAIEDGRKRSASATVMARIAQGENRTVTRNLNRHRAEEFARAWSNPMLANPHSIGLIPKQFPTVDSTTRPLVVAAVTQRINEFARDLEVAKEMIHGLNLPAKEDGPLVALPELLEMIATGEATFGDLPSWVSVGEKNLAAAKSFIRKRL